MLCNPAASKGAQRSIASCVADSGMVRRSPTLSINWVELMPVLEYDELKFQLKQCV